MIQALESGRSQTANELAAAVNVSRRTLYRDLELLANAGLRYSYDRETKQYAVQRSMLLPPVSLSHAEALALLLAVRAVERRGDLADRTTATSAALKLESMLPKVLRDEVGSLIDLVEVCPEPISDTPSIQESLSLIQTALSRRNVLRVRYDSYLEGKMIDAIVHPYRLVFIHRGWYLIAFTRVSSEVRTYKVERIVRLRRMEEVFCTDPRFTLEDYFGNAWLMIRGEQTHHVSIRFLPKVAGNVDEIAWHKTQRTRYETDGSLLFEADLDGLEEISWWILGYGDQAQVLKPQELKTLVASRVRGMYEYYHDAQFSRNDSS